MLKNLVKREAEGSYLGFWVPKHINSDTCIFLNETVLLKQNLWFLDIMVNFYSLWNITALHNNSKIAFLGIFVRKLCFYSFGCGFSVLYSLKSIFWYKNQASLTLQWNFMRQNMLKNVVKREAEGIYLGVWVLKHIYSDTCIFLSCSTQWSGSFETKFVVFGHYAQFLQSLEHHCPPVWHHDNSKIEFLGIFDNKLCFY